MRSLLLLLVLTVMITLLPLEVGAIVVKQPPTPAHPQTPGPTTPGPKSKPTAKQPGSQLPSQTPANAPVSPRRAAADPRRPRVQYPTYRKPTVPHNVWQALSLTDSYWQKAVVLNQGTVMNSVKGAIPCRLEPVPMIAGRCIPLPAVTLP